MAVQNGLGNRTLQTHTMRAVKQMMRGLLGGVSGVSFTNSTTPTTGAGAHGVVGDDDLKVTAQGSPNMSVSVAVGTAFILQDGNAHAGTGSFYNDAALTVNLTAAHATLPRIDLIIAQMRDNTEDGSGQNDWQITKVDGTPNASPTVPAIPAGSLVLAQVAVAAADTTITNADITDRRVYAAVGGGPLRVSSTLKPTVGRWLGRLIAETNNSGRLLSWNGSAWRGIRTTNHQAVGLGIVGSFSPSAASTATLTIPDQGCDGTLYLYYMSYVSGTTGESFQVSIEDSTATTIHSAARVYAGSSVTVVGHVAMPAGASMTILGRMIRSVGSNNATVVADARFHQLRALFVPSS